MSNIQIKLNDSSAIHVINTERPSTIQQILPKKDEWKLNLGMLYWLPINETDVVFDGTNMVSESFRPSIQILDIKKETVLVMPIVANLIVKNGDVISGDIKPTSDVE